MNLILFSRSSGFDDEINDHRKEIVPTIDYPLFKAMFRIIRPIHGWKVSSGILPSDLGSILTFGLVIMYLIPQVVGGVILFGLFSQLGLLGVIWNWRKYVLRNYLTYTLSSCSNNHYNEIYWILHNSANFLIVNAADTS